MWRIATGYFIKRLICVHLPMKTKGQDIHEV